MGVFLERNHAKQINDFSGYQETMREYRRLYRGSQKMDFAIWVLYKDEESFKSAFRNTLFLSIKSRELLVQEAKKVEESSGKLE